MSIAIYLRVSTSLQSTESQLTAIEQYCKNNNIVNYTIYKDEGISGAKESRPGLDALMGAARNKEIDTVIVYSFSRFARSTKHLLQALDEFHSLNINFVSISEKLETQTAIGRAIFTIIGSIAELERHLIRERVVSGLNNAKKNGKRLGAPKKEINRSLLEHLLAQNLSYKEMSKLLNVSASTICRELKTFQKSAG